MSSTSLTLPSRAAPDRLYGILIAMAGSIAFAGKAIIVKLCYRHGVDAVTVIMLRMAFALPLFLWLSVRAGKGRPALTFVDWLRLAALGASGYYLASFLDFAGLQYISANLERLILYLTPTLVLVASRLLFKIRVTQGQWLALIVSYLGVGVVFGHDLVASTAHVALGAALVLGGAIAYASYLTFSGPAIRRYGAGRTTGIATTFACLMCIGQFLLLRPIAAAAVAPEVLWLSLLNATVCTYLPVTLTMLAIEKIGAPLVAQSGNAGPIATVLLSTLILGEPFTVWTAAGTVLVLVGIALLARQR